MRRAPLAPLNLAAYSQDEVDPWELAQQLGRAQGMKRAQDRTAAAHPARKSFGDFTETTTQWKLDDWQWKICNRLGKIIDERQTGVRILIHSFPQAGKSVLVSQRFPAYTIGKIPDYRLRMACYNQTHSERFGEVILQILNEPVFAEAFPGVGVPPLRTASGEWSTDARRAVMDGQPSFRALGIRAGFVGLGADLLIVDDPYAGADEAYSDTINANVWRWWTDTVAPRLNPTTNVVVMFHRWRVADLAGMLMREGGWEVMRFPAIADGLENDCSGLAPGEMLSPRYPRAFIEAFKEKHPLQFQSLYQGMPGDAFGNLIRSDWFRNFHDKGDYYVLDQPNGQQQTVRKSSVWIMASVDWASSDLKTADNTAITILGVTPRKDLLALENKVGREEGPEAVKMVDEVLRKWDPAVVLSEKNSLGLPMTQYLTRLGWTVKGIWQHKQKEVRAQSLAEAYSSGRIYHPGSVPPWLADFTAELLAFPSGDHDDRLDTLSTAIRSLPGVSSVISDFNQSIHTAPAPINCEEDLPLLFGWGFEPVNSCVICQHVEGQLRVLASLTAYPGEGVEAFALRVAVWAKEAVCPEGYVLSEMEKMSFGPHEWLGGAKGNYIAALYLAGEAQGERLGLETVPVTDKAQDRDEGLRIRCRVLNEGIPALIVDPEATDLISALSGGYCYKTDKDGILQAAIEVNPAVSLVCALGCVASLVSAVRARHVDPMTRYAQAMSKGVSTTRAAGYRGRGRR